MNRRSNTRGANGDGTIRKRSDGRWEARYSFGFDPGTGKQVQKSVYFDDSIKAMADMGIDAFVEIGPGKTLSKFVQKTVSDIPVYGVETVEDIEKLLEEIK